MKQVNEFLNRIELQKAADKLLKDSYRTDESEIAHLVNNDSSRHATGKLAQYKVLLNTCTFKLAVYFDVDKFGRQYTIEEKKNRQHLRHIPSNDAVNGKTNHEQALNELIQYCLDNCSRIDAAQLYYIDRFNGLEHYIFRFDAKNIARSDFRQVGFKQHHLTGATIVDKLLDAPIRTDKIKTYNKK